MDMWGDGSSLVQIVKVKISEKADVQSRNLTLVINRIAEPLISDTTDTTNDDNTKCSNRHSMHAVELSQWSGKSLCKLCRPLLSPAMLDNWHCSS